MKDISFNMIASLKTFLVYCFAIFLVVVVKPNHGLVVKLLLLHLNYLYLYIFLIVETSFHAFWKRNI